MVSNRTGGPIDLARRRTVGGLALAAATTAAPVRAQQTQAEGASRHGATHGRAARRSLAISAAFAPGGDLWVVGLNGELRLTLWVSRDGRTLGTPRVLDTGRDTIAAEGEARPKIAFGPQGRVVITYTQPLALPYTGEIRMLRSVDGGRTFGPPFTVHQDRQVITHRFDSVAFDATGALHTLWIDKRAAEAARRAAASPAAAKTAYAGAAIYRNVSLDGGATFGPDQRLADHSCECCRIALAADPAGGLAVLWRHVFDGNVRDHAFARIGPAGDGATAVERATFDGWAIDACPHHGPSLARAPDGGYCAVWFGERGGEPAARYGRLAPDGKPMGDVRALPDPGAEHATVATAGDTLAIAWRSYDGEATRVRAMVSIDAGSTFSPRDVAASADDNDYPLLVARDRGVLVVWRTVKEIRIERLA